MYNTKQSITDFAQSSFKLAVEKKLPLVRFSISFFLPATVEVLTRIRRTVHVDQEHHPQGLRRSVEGHLPGDLRLRVQGQVRGARYLVRAPPHRRRAYRLFLRLFLLSSLPVLSSFFVDLLTFSSFPPFRPLPSFALSPASPSLLSRSLSSLSASLSPSIPSFSPYLSPFVVFPARWSPK
jgi:hypothetical protein